MERMKFVVEFVFDQKKKLYLHIKAFWKQDSVNLSLSTFLTFLFKNEKYLHPADREFAYALAKFIKKVKIGSHYLEAIPNDLDQALFFKKALEYDIPLKWKKGNQVLSMGVDETLSLHITVSKHHDSVSCTLTNRQEWLDNPLAWLPFRADKDVYCFCFGTLILNPSYDLEHFLDLFLEKSTIQYKSFEIFHFIRNIYEPNKNMLYWKIPADLFQLLPKSTPPIPVLKLEYDGRILTPTLSYRYGNQQVTADDHDDIIRDSGSATLYHRMLDMESIYQQDLMSLFMESNLPFLLENPGDIGKFLDQVVPVLKHREWEIISEVSDFSIIDKPVDIEFMLHSDSNINWFYFEPNCEINGEKLSLQEVARLMIQNQGYIKTNAGFVKMSESSQNELSVLTKFGAFKPGQKFNKAEILPLIASSTITGSNEPTKALIKDLQNVYQSNVDPGPGFKGVLRDYQQYGVNWIQFLYRVGFGGVLADDMGLGKTVQTIAFSNQIPDKGPILVVGPTNVIFNWEKEIRFFTPDATMLVYTGAKRVQELRQLESVDYVITSFGVLKNDIELLGAIYYKAIFVDEAQYIKNPRTQISKAVKSLKGRFKLAMTGTPIENHLQDLWNLFDFTMPSYLGSQHHFESEIKNGNKEFFKAKIRPFVLRREKREVLDSLPDKTEIIVKCPLSPAQQALYETVLSAAKKGIQNLDGRRERLNILAALLKLRQVCIHPAILKEFRNHDIESGKFELVKEKILELMDEGHKVVLFSQFTDMLDILEEWTKLESIYTERIDGSVTGKHRIEAVDRFQEAASAGLFIISLKAGGVGINLTAADYVIHLDPWWNPAIESQATDRVHRMGQKNKVIVYKMISEGTIEEKIQQLQESKRELLSQIIDIDSAEEKKIDFEELKKLL